MVLFGDFRYFCQILYQKKIGGRAFQINQIRIFPNRPFYLFRIGALHKGNLHAETLHILRQETVGRAVNTGNCHHMAVLFQIMHHRCADGSHTGGKAFCRLSLFQGRHLIFHNLCGRIGHPRISITTFPVPFVSFTFRKQGTLENRRCHRTCKTGRIFTIVGTYFFCSHLSALLPADSPQT